MDTFASLSTRIGNEWYLLGIELGFQHSQLEQLREAYPYNISQCIASLLNAWLDVIQTEKADPWTILSKALKVVNRTDLADEFTINDEVDGITSTKANHSITRRIQDIKFQRSRSSIQDYIDQSLQYLKHKNKDKHMFVDTVAFNRVTSWYKSKHSVLIVGNAGDGKSSIAINLLSSLQEQGYTVIVLSDPALIEQVYDSNLRIVYFVDDAFGSPTMKKSLVDIWIRIHDKTQGLIEESNCGLVLTSRKLVYQASAKYFSNCLCYTENVIDLTDEKLILSIFEKQELAVKYFENSGNEKLLSKYLWSITPTYTPGFPFVCRMHSRNDSFESDKLGCSPLTLMKQEMHVLARNEPCAFCGLLLIAILDGRLPRDFFDPFERMDNENEKKIEAIMRAYGLDPCKDKLDIYRHMESMIGVYIEDMNGDFVFLHDLIFDSLCLEFGQRSPSEILRIASSEFISERVRTEDIKEVNENDVIILKKSKYPLLAKRWIKDMQERNVSDVYDNPSFRDNIMFDTFMKEVSKLSDDELWNIICIEDTKRGKTYLKLACVAGFEHIAVNILNKIDMRDRKVTSEEKHALNHALYETVESGYLYVIKAILQLNVVDVNASFPPSRHQCLHQAAIYGHPMILEILLIHGANVSPADRFGITPLHYACGSGHYDCVKVLVEYGASVVTRDNVGRLPMLYACSSNNVEVIRYLMLHQAHLHVPDIFNKFPIHFAARNTCPDILDFLITNGCPVNVADDDSMTPLHLASQKGLFQNMEILLSHKAEVNVKGKDGSTPLHMACHRKNKNIHSGIKCVKLLIDHQSDVNVVDIIGSAPLHGLCAWPCDSAFEILQILLKQKANPNVLDIGNWTPLMSACTSGSSKCVQLLLEYKADPFVHGINGRYPIHIACQNDSTDTVEALLEYGISIDTQDEEGRQPIHIASQYGNIKLVNFLLDKGSDVNAVTFANATPLHLACKGRKQDIISLLVNRGADITLKTEDGQTAEDFVNNYSTDQILIKKMKKCLNICQT